MALLSGKTRFNMLAVDKITGFTGIVTGFAQYVTGCDQYLVTPRCDAGKISDIKEAHWFDVNRLNFSKPEKAPKKVSTGRSKGAMTPAPRK